MFIRPAVIEDIPVLEGLYARARVYMREQGNHTQWGESYPLTAQMEDVEEDISLGRSFVCVDGEEIAGVFMLTAGPDPTYACIEDGGWPDEEPYGVVHRITTGGTRNGVGEFCLRWCLQRYDNLRIDTHADNRPMRALLDKLGFVYCGIIHVEDGTPRRAYCKNRET